MVICRKKTLFSLVSILVTILFCLIFNNTANAVVSGWSAGNIMTDAVMTNVGSMSVNDIQNFLNSKVPNCDTNGSLPATEYGRSDLTHAQYAASRGWNGAPYTCLKDYSENGLSAAQIIYNTSQQYQINPQVLIVLLQKEQNLVLDTWPLQIQYRSATGYGCPDTAACDSQYYGFTNQVNWSAKMFRAILNQSSTWYTPYTVGNNSILWNPNSSCGSHDVNIENLATAALYSYTPYQPNQAALNADFGTGDSCSAYGNRNFYLYFTSWFGNPRGDAYSWNLVSQEAFIDQDYTTPFTQGINLEPGEKAYFRITVKNIGYRTWGNNVHLGTTRETDRISLFADSSWLGANRVSLKSSNILSNGSGIFEFSITAPSQAGTYQEYFSLVADGESWFNDPGLYYTINVSEAVSPGIIGPNLQSGDQLFRRQALSLSNNSQIILQEDGNLVLYANTGKALWSSGTSGSGATKAIMQSDGNFVLYTKTMKPVWSSGTSGSGATKAIMQSDGNFVLYTSNNQAIWSTNTSYNPVQIFNGKNIIENNEALQTGQYIQASGRLQFILQGDGNLVLYTNEMRAVWSSGTDGTGATRLILQDDGNLVLYTNEMRAVWSSGTDGTGATRLILQDDGNLVLYTNEMRAVWSSGTDGTY